MKQALLPLGGSSGGGSSSVSVATPYEAPNNLSSTSISRALGIISEGEIVGLINGAQSIFFDDTPLEEEDGTRNFEGVTYHERYGTPDQEYVEGFPTVESEHSVQATVTDDVPVMRTITNLETDIVRVRVGLPYGLVYQKSNGDLIEHSVGVAFDVRADGGDWVTKVDTTIMGKTTTQYERSYSIRLATVGDGPWDIRMRRTTENLESSSYREETSWAAYTEVIEDKLIYPDTAVIGMAVDAEQFGNSIPQVSFDVRGLIVQVPSNYDPETRTYDGVWDGTFQRAWTNNPAWCVYDLMTESRYGLGLSEDEVDKWALYEIGKYCDELVDDGFGGTEPRFTLNCVLQTQEDAYHVINTFLSACRTLCFWGSGMVTFSQDAPDTPTHIASPSLVEGGVFNYQGSGIRNRHSAALVTWNDPADAYKPTVEAVEDLQSIASRGWNPTDVVAFGCTSRGQANRLGKWILDTENQETELVSFVGGFQFADARPGNLVQIADPDVMGIRAGGRIRSATATTITIDDPILIDPEETPILTIVLPDQTTQDVGVVNSDGYWDVLELEEELITLPQAGAGWIVTASNVAPRLFRILSNREVEPHKYEITAAERDPSKFARVEQGLQLDPAPISLIPTGRPSMPSAIGYDEFLYVAGESFASGVLVSWTRALDSRIIRHEVQIKRPGQDWELIDVTSGASATIYNTPVGVYSLRVRSITSSGRLSAWKTVEDVQLLGLNQPPNDVTGVVVVVQSGGAVIAWDPVEDWRAVSYEVRKGAAWDTAQIIGTTSNLSMDILGDGTYLIRAKAAGAYSDNATIAVADGSVLVANVIASVDEKADGWDGAMDASMSVESMNLVLAGGVENALYQVDAAKNISLAQVSLCNVTFDYTLSGSGPADIYDWTDVYAVSDIYGGYGQYVGAEPQISIQKENDTWTEWQRFVPGRYAGKGFAFRIALSSLREDVEAVLSELVCSVDVPDRVVAANAVAVSSSGLTVTFSPPFQAIPSVVGQVVGALGGEDIEFSAISTTGFTVFVKDKTDAYADRTINYIAQGY